MTSNLFISNILDNNNNKIILISTIIFFIVLVLVLTLFLFLNLTRTKQNETNYNTRLYVYDYQKKSVYSIDKKNLRNKKHFTESEFYKEFDPKDKTKVENFIFHAIKNEDYKPILEVRVNLKNKLKIHSSKFVYAFLEITSVNRETKTIYLQSNLLSNYNTVENKSSRYKNHLVQLERISSSVAKNDFKLAYVYCMQLTPISEATMNVDEDEILTIRTKLMEQLIVALNKDSYLIPFKKDSICFVKLSDKPQNDIAESNHLLQICYKLLYLNSYDDNYEISIGVDIYDQEKNKSTLLESFEHSLTAAKLSKKIKGKKNKVALYGNENVIRNYEADSLQIKNIILNDDYKLFFKPVVDIKKGEILFYRVEIETLNGGLLKLEDLMSFSLNEDLSIKLFSNLTKRISTYVREDKEIKVFIPTTFKFLTAIVNTDYKFDVDLFTPIFGLKEKVLEQFETEELQQVFTSCTNRTYQLAFLFSRQIHSIATDIMESFSYFVIDKSFVDKVNEDEQKQTSVHLACYSVENFRKPFCVFDCANTYEIKYCQTLNIKYFSSEVLLAKSPYPVEISDTEKEKIIKMFERKKFIN